MDACLYGPGGFFTGGELRSTKSGDFLTSPEVSPYFGRTIARFVDDVWRAAGEPSSWTVCDVGAGSGSLLRPLIESAVAPLTTYAVDVSPAARRALEDIADQVVDEVPDGCNVIICNELLDNIPVAIAVKTDDGGWRERFVGADDSGSGLVLVDAPARPDVAAWADAYCGVVPAGGLVEVQLGASEWVSTAVRSLAPGGVLVAIDYGGTAEELEPRRTLGTLRTYRAHHLGPDPLLGPGETDVTVDVNFTAMIAAAEAAGAAVELNRQDDFLEELGLRAEVSTMRKRELELARGTDAMARLAVKSEMTDADTLLHPRGLGDFRVLVARREL